MIVTLDSYFVEAMRKNGYEIDYNELIKIYVDSCKLRKESIQRINEYTLKQIEEGRL